MGDNISMNNDDQLKKIHSLELKIALEVKRICDKYSIPYFLTAGTTLGAVRHKGFIPWDDDMDIGMLRANYIRFIEVCENELGEEFFLQTWDSDSQYPFSFGKIRLNNTHMIEGFSKNQNETHNGIFIDIFPFDNVPDNSISRKIQGYKYYICKRLLWIKKGMGDNMKEQSFKQRFRYNLFYLFSCLFSYERVKNYYKKAQVKYNNTITQKVVTDGSYTYSKESIERVWVENLELVSFETEKFLTYKDRKKYLEYFYGDYMKLPPVEKRNRHALINVDFGPY